MDGTYATRKWRLNLGAIFLLIINSAIQVYAATKMTVVADSLIDHQNVIFLRELGTVFLLWTSTFLIGLLQIYIQQTAIQDMSILIRKDIVAGLVAINLEDYKKHDGSVYESWLQNDVNLIEQHAFNSFFYTVRFFCKCNFFSDRVMVLSLYTFYCCLLRRGATKSLTGAFISRTCRPCHFG
ncbi:ABC transporter ATP-binding protein [Sporolactobacillus terrae]|uniref:ABC transporter ATP-binding protein n=1 Tax=Sporolactobacillus terrae TaxID=269673 RepID=UPI001119E962|nr:ABC transporter ATP-binding protein [Sporolactobacillus terrae]